MSETKRGGWERKPFGLEKQRRFLEALSECCNVRAACAAAKVSPTEAYTTRRRRPDFAEAWSEALAAGYDELEHVLLAHTLTSLGAEDDAAGDAGAAGGGGDDGDAAELAKPGHAQPGSGLVRTRLSQANVQLALLLLNRHRATVEGTGKGLPRGKRRPTAEETNQALTAKLDALARKLKRDL